MRLCTWEDSSTTLAADNATRRGGDFERSKSALLWMGAALRASERAERERRRAREIRRGLFMQMANGEWRRIRTKLIPRSHIARSRLDYT